MSAVDVHAYMDKQFRGSLRAYADAGYCDEEAANTYMVVHRKLFTQMPLTDQCELLQWLGNLSQAISLHKHADAKEDMSTDLMNAIRLGARAAYYTIRYGGRVDPYKGNTPPNDGEGDDEEHVNMTLATMPVGSVGHNKETGLLYYRTDDYAACLSDHTKSVYKPEDADGKSVQVTVFPNLTRFIMQTAY